MSAADVTVTYDEASDDVVGDVAADDARDGCSCFAVVSDNCFDVQSSSSKSYKVSEMYDVAADDF